MTGAIVRQTKMTNLSPSARSGTDLALNIQALEGLDLHGLREVWRLRIGPAPKLRSTKALGLMLAFRLQAERLGGIDAETRRALRRPVSKTSAAKARSGTRLCREWQGELHEVTADGPRSFLYRGERWTSLSKIARQITGTRWNGPRFFGLRDGDGS